MVPGIDENIENNSHHIFENIKLKTIKIKP